MIQKSLFCISNPPLYLRKRISCRRRISTKSLRIDPAVFTTHLKLGTFSEGLCSPNRNSLKHVSGSWSLSAPLQPIRKTPGKIIHNPIEFISIFIKQPLIVLIALLDKGVKELFNRVFKTLYAV